MNALYESYLFVTTEMSGSPSNGSRETLHIGDLRFSMLRGLIEAGHISELGGPKYIN